MNHDEPIVDLSHGILVRIGREDNSEVNDPQQGSHYDNRNQKQKKQQQQQCRRESPWEEETTTTTMTMMTSSTRPIVLVIYTGGTLGMAPIGPNGSLAPSPDYLTERLHMMTEFHTSAMPLFDVFAYHNLKDSSNIECGDWCRMALDIEHFYYLYDGFVVAHGTDTLHYTASALSFALGHISKPVIVTGSSIPLKRPYNDARRNLATALIFAAQPDICEVCVCVNDWLLRGNRSIKYTNAIQLFTSPNYPPLGEWKGGEVCIHGFRLLRQPTSPLIVQACFRPTVFHLSLEGMTGANAILTAAARLLSSSSSSSSSDTFSMEAIVMSLPDITLSSGMRYATELEAFAVEAYKAGCPLLVVPHYQCGTFSPACLSVLQTLIPSGIFLDDMTPHTAVVKAMYVLALLHKPKVEKKQDHTVSQNVFLSTFRKWMVTSLRGEVTCVSDPFLLLGQHHSNQYEHAVEIKRMDAGRRWTRSQWEAHNKGLEVMYDDDHSSVPVMGKYAKL